MPGVGVVLAVGVEFAAGLSLADLSLAGLAAAGATGAARTELTVAEPAAVVPAGAAPAALAVPADEAVPADVGAADCEGADCEGTAIIEMCGAPSPGAAGGHALVTDVTAAACPAATVARLAAGLVGRANTATRASASSTPPRGARGGGS